VRLGILTDIHHRPPGSPPDGWHNPHQFETVLGRLVESLAWLRNEGVDRVAVLGDLAHDGDVASLRGVVDVIGGSGLPAWLVPGNHDLGHGVDTLATAVAAAGHDQVEIIGTGAVPLADDWLVTGVGIAQAPGGGYQGEFLPDSTIPPGAPLLVLSHFPILTTREAVLGAGLKYAGDLANAAEIADALTRRAGPSLVVSGHLHVRHATANRAVLQASCGAQVESLFEVTVVDFGAWGAGAVTWAATAIQPAWPGVNPALSDPTQTWTWRGGAWSPSSHGNRHHAPSM